MNFHSLTSMFYQGATSPGEHPEETVFVELRGLRNGSYRIRQLRSWLHPSAPAASVSNERKIPAEEGVSD